MVNVANIDYKKVEELSILNKIDEQTMYSLFGISSKAIMRSGEIGGV